MVQLFHKVPNKDNVPFTSSGMPQNYGTLPLSSCNPIYSNPKINFSDEKFLNLKKWNLLSLIGLMLVLACFASAFVFWSAIFSKPQSLDIKIEAKTSKIYDFTSGNQHSTESKASANFSTELEFSNCFPTCQTKWCGIYSAILNSSMDKTVDPCEDFYEHVCANWNIQTHSYLGHMLENTHDIIEFALEEQMLTRSSKSRLLHYMGDLYRDCVDLPTREQLNLGGLLKQLLGDDNHLLSQFGNSTNQGNERSKSIDSYSDFEKAWNSWKQNPQLWFNQSHDRPDVEQWMDLFVEASLIKVDTLIEHVQISGSKIFIMFNEAEAYKNGIDNTNVYAKFKELKSEISLFFKIDQWDSSLNYILFEIVDFKIELTKLRDRFKIVQDYNYLRPLIKFTSFFSNENFNWKLLFRKFANKTGASTQFLYDPSVQIATQNFKLLSGLFELISQTPIRVLKNLMACQYMSALQILKINKKLFTEKSDVPASSPQHSRLWREFVDNDFDMFLPLYTRLFIDYVGREQMQKGREQANEMMRNMKRTFCEALKSDYSWIDDETRGKALEKVNLMRSMISHPDWIFDDAALDEEFGFDHRENFSSNKGNFAASYLKLYRIVQSAQFRKLNQKQSLKRKFDFTFKGIGIHYTQSNRISITHALLLDPSFNLDYPIGLNYGHLGTTLSHELIHGFDNDGIEHDEHGHKIENWWSNYSAKEHKNRSQCFVQQYDQLGLNGTFTLGENIADNGGLGLAYRLLVKHINHSKGQKCQTTGKKLPPFLAKYSHEQRFFLAYGLDNCSHRMHSTKWNSTNPHSPAKYRVNVPLQNFGEFSRAFNCPVGSKMNPEKKCLLW